MTERFVDPDGLDISPYISLQNAAVALNKVDVILEDGDVVIMSDRQDHAMNSNMSIVANNILIRNTANDNDFTKVGFASWVADKGINLGGDNLALEIKGIDISSATYTESIHAAVATKSNAAGQTIILDGMRFNDIDASGATANGGCLRMNGAEVSTNNLLIKNCVFENNLGGDTAGAMIGYIHNYNVIFDNTIIQNNGDKDNGFSGHFLIDTNTSGNKATVRNGCLFHNNSARTPGPDTTSDGDGGAIYFYSEDGNQLEILVEDSVFSSNFARKGGAFWCGQDTFGLVQRNIFLENTCSDFGGGAIGKGANTITTVDSFLQIESNLFVRNEQLPGTFGGAGGGAIRVDPARYANIINNTFIDNTADGEGQSIWVRDHAVGGTANKSTAVNNVFTGSGVQVVGEGNDGFATIDHCAATDGLSGFQDTGATITFITETETSDYANYAGDDFSLSSGSSLRSAGNDSVLPLNDINNDPFVSVVDIGSYAFIGESPTLTTSYAVIVLDRGTSGSINLGANWSGASTFLIQELPFWMTQSGDTGTVNYTNVQWGGKNSDNTIGSGVWNIQVQAIDSSGLLTTETSIWLYVRP